MNSLTQKSVEKDSISEENIFEIMEEAMGPLGRGFVCGDFFELIIQPDGTIFGKNSKDIAFPAARAFQSLNGIDYKGDTYDSLWLESKGNTLLSSRFYDGPSGGKRRCYVVFPPKVTEQLLDCISNILSFTSTDGRSFYNIITLWSGINYVDISVENLTQKVDYSYIRNEIDKFADKHGITKENSKNNQHYRQ